MPSRPHGSAGGFRSLLVPVDLSPASDRVVGRVALLPFASRARVTLLHVVPENLPPRARGRAERDARRALADERTSLLEALPRGVAVEAVVRKGAPAPEITDRAGALGAELVVMGRGGGRGLRDHLLGSTAERVIRRGRLLVLAVRLRPLAAYRRPALALDLDRGLDDAVALLLRLLPPRPRVAVIHAYAVPLAGMSYPSLSDEDDRAHYRQQARDALARRLATALARGSPRARHRGGGCNCATGIRGASSREP